MTQTHASKASFDKNTLQALTSLQPNQHSLTPRHKQFNLGSLDLTKIKSALPTSIADGEGPIKLFRGSLTTRNADKTDLVDVLVTPKKSIGGFGNSNKNFSPVKSYKKIKLKPLVPKFNFNLPSLTKDSSPKSSRDESKRPSVLLHNSNSAKLLLNMEELALALPTPKKRASFVLKSDKITDIATIATPLSARLPTITLRTMEDSLKLADFDAVKVLFSEEESSDPESKKKNNPMTSQIDTKNILKTPNRKLSEDSEGSNLLKRQSNPSNQQEKKNHIMHFGAVKTPKTFYFPLGNPIDLNERFQNTVSTRNSQKLKKKGNDIQHVPAALDSSFEKPQIQPQEEQKRVTDQALSVTLSPVLTGLKAQQEREAKRSPSPNSSKSASFSNEEQNKELALEQNESYVKKASFENQTSPTAQTLTLHLKTSEDWSNFVGAHKKSVTFTDSGSIVSGSGSPANSDGHSAASPALKSSLKKAALEGKVVKLSGFAGETKPSDTLEQQELSRKNTPPMQSEEKEPEDQLNVFKSNNNNVNFFEINEENLFMNKRRHSNVNDIIMRSKGWKPQVETKEDTAAPVIISYPGEPHSIIIQPKYMETYGSMCFTELWSDKSKSQYKYLKKEEIGMLKKVYAAAEDAVYRSERAAKKHAVQTRMFYNRMESSSPSRRQTEMPMQRQSLSPKRRPSFHFETTPVQNAQNSGSPRMRGVIDAPIKPMKSRKLSLFLPSY